MEGTTLANDRSASAAIVSRTAPARALAWVAKSPEAAASSSADIDDVAMIECRPLGYRSATMRELHTQAALVCVQANGYMHTSMSHAEANTNAYTADRPIRPSRADKFQ